MSWADGNDSLTDLYFLKRTSKAMFYPPVHNPEQNVGHPFNLPANDVPRTTNTKSENWMTSNAETNSTEQINFMPETSRTELWCWPSAPDCTNRRSGSEVLQSPHNWAKLKIDKILEANLEKVNVPEVQFGTHCVVWPQNPQSSSTGGHSQILLIFSRLQGCTQKRVKYMLGTHLC